MQKGLGLEKSLPLCSKQVKVRQNNKNDLGSHHHERR